MLTLAVIRSKAMALLCFFLNLLFVVTLGVCGGLPGSSRQYGLQIFSYSNSLKIKMIKRYRLLIIKLCRY